MKSIIVIPTYNEKENIKKLIEEIFTLEEEIQVIVVDDHSSDGTGEVLDELAQKNPQLKVIYRPKKLGLGTAYVEGFKLALKEKPQFIFQMDGDFSHLPEYIPDMLSAIKDCHLVIGSRYVQGGGIRNWSIWRKLLSRVANLYARLITKMPIFDTTSGFKCFRKEVLENINLDKIYSNGYAFQIEMNYLVCKKGFLLKEIPIIFYERRRGRSKLGRKIIWEAIGLVWKLRFRSKFDE